MDLVSNCCTASVSHVDGDLGMCDKCKEWCEVVDLDEEEK